MRFLIALACVLAACVQLTLAELLTSLSFNKPFDTISADGEREVSKDWTHGGSTAVNRHFVRLTPDRQSRKGYIWSKEKLGRREFSLVLTFRISGQAQTWFGDGLALWITTSPSYVAGDNHGFTGNFKGFGFVFDTFVNQEHSGGHMDVTFLENNGSRTLDDLYYMPKVGCMAPGIRYHEGNAAFSPSLNMSRAKVQFANHFVTISIDAKNTGEWEECYRTELLIPEHWIEESTIGLTASTGGLADNHDVISVQVFDEISDAGHNDSDEKVRGLTEHLDEATSSVDNEARLRMLKRKYQQLVEDFEHQFTALKESTENTIKKLREQEAEDTARIQDLELWAEGKVAESVYRSVSEVREEVEDKLKKTVEETAKKTGSWKTPFFVLVLVLGGLCAVGYKKYQDLRKSHLL
ncbi:hypothetical protein Poli38472_000700 [Pythium oligandrum]|uniref:L-type lectin-like domain-containing protein n=1 Tax=Pythium oligandrum TaxID=41045 RepID=A0A8K1FJE1_PYTOL|nr:hypothetical protein Poli38472_000700 [Pythium oligandrum]|eukprot:TMW60658.1 hypothetical protein Poli38472_000700 [Pythium oligandrum]